MTIPPIDENATLILDEAAVERKIRRMAFEIFEHNAEEKEIILAGITDRGTTVAQLLSDKLKAIAPFQITLVEIKIDKVHPLNAILKNDIDCNGKCIIVVDDVANSGRTMLYALQPFMKSLPDKIQTVVLIDRMHKSFPVSIDYTGYRLSTTLQENVRVDMEEGRIKGAYLV